MLLASVLLPDAGKPVIQSTTPRCCNISFFKVAARWLWRVCSVWFKRLPFIYDLAVRSLNLNVTPGKILSVKPKLNSFITAALRMYILK